MKVYCIAQQQFHVFRAFLLLDLDYHFFEEFRERLMKFTNRNEECQKYHIRMQVQRGWNDTEHRFANPTTHCLLLPGQTEMDNN